MFFYKDKYDAYNNWWIDLSKTVKVICKVLRQKRLVTLISASEYGVFLNLRFKKE